MIKQLRMAADALNRGDARPFASLFADESQWRGVSSGLLWWKHTPAWYGPDEAREVLTAQIKTRTAFSVQPRFIRIGDDRIIGQAQWIDNDGLPDERYYVLTFRDGLIVDMQGCATRRQAIRFARQPQPR
jgi:ketosteroid isomerase-like protein